MWSFLNKSGVFLKKEVIVYKKKELLKRDFRLAEISIKSI